MKKSRNGASGTGSNTHRKTRVLAGGDLRRAHPTRQSGNGIAGAREKSRIRARNSAISHDGPTRSRASEHALQLERAVQRYGDLYDFAPTGYVSFDRSGRVVEINLTAAQLFGLPRDRMIGMPFSVFVFRPDTMFFLEHLLRCRASETRVETELRLKNLNRDIIYAELCSTPITASVEDGAVLYQTAIIDLTERKAAEGRLAETARQQSALYAFARRSRDTKGLKDICAAGLDTIVSALQCDRASILLCDENAVMRFVAWRDLSDKYRKAVEGHSPWKSDATNPEALWLADIEQVDLPRSLKAAIRTEGIRAVAFIPLVADKKLIGKFMAYYNSARSPTETELKLATTIAQQLVQVILHKRDEEALRESEARMRATVEQATAGVSRCDINGRIVFANRKLCQLLGYTERELIGKNIADVTHAHDVKTNMRRFRQMVRDGNPYEIEKRFVRKDSSILWADVSASAVRDLDGKTQSTVAVIVDMTARKKAEIALQRTKGLLEKRVRARTHELRKANQELQAEIERRKGLEGEILSVSDREQQRLGQELHDGLCQHLTAVAFMARSVAMRLRKHRVIDATDIEKIAQLVNDAVSDTRDLSRALHRMDVDAAGLVTALRDLADREIWRTPCQLLVRPSFRIEDDTAAAHLYRIAREAVINANKHAQAREITIKAERSREGMVLRVLDDGVGFGANRKVGQGLGLHIMKYRAQLMGGRLEIDSPKAGGTRVSCYLPNDVSQSNRAPIGVTPERSGVSVLSE